MTKPMYCPMLFAMSAHYHLNEPMECTPDCAWALNNGKEYWCCHTEKSLKHGYTNKRPLKDDAE